MFRNIANISYPTPNQFRPCFFPFNFFTLLERFSYDLDMTLKWKRANKTETTNERK